MYYNILDKLCRRNKKEEIVYAILWEEEDNNRNLILKVSPTKIARIKGDFNLKKEVISPDLAVYCFGDYDKERMLKALDKFNIPYIFLENTI